MRNYAIILKKADRDVVSNIALRIRDFDSDCKVRIFSRAFPKDLPDWVDTTEIPEDVYEKDSKIHNFVVKWYFENGTKGFLHVFMDGYEVVSDKFSKFVPEIEEFMGLFKYDVWLNTFTDECNFIFDKWIPRVYVDINEEALMKKYSKKIMLTSNANTNYIIYNLDLLKIDDVLFDETFSIAMFYIIKFFAERRNRKIPGAFMNLYPTLESENGILKKVKENPKDLDKSEKDKMDKESEEFKKMNVDIHPTEHYEEALDFIIDTLSK